MWCVVTDRPMTLLVDVKFSLSQVHRLLVFTSVIEKTYFLVNKLLVSAARNQESEWYRTMYTGLSLLGLLKYSLLKAKCFSRYGEACEVHFIRSSLSIQELKKIFVRVLLMAVVFRKANIILILIGLNLVMSGGCQSNLSLIIHPSSTK